MGKVIIALLSVLLLVGLAVGGVYLYKNMDPTGASATADAQEDQDEDEEVGDPRAPLGKMKPAKSTSDIPGLLTYSMEKSLDAVGWLDVPGTDISQVVMQGSDNNYYERRNEDGKSDIYGCYFLDMECSLGDVNAFKPNTVIYGHSDLKDNPDGPRFSQLFRFVDDTFAAENRYMFVTTLEGRFTFEIFSAFYTDISFDYIRVHMNEEETLALAKEAQAKSVRDYGVTLKPNDRLLTLSTCSVRDGNDGSHRFVLMGRLVDAEPSTSPPSTPETETEAVPESKAVTESDTQEKPNPQQQPVMPEIQIPQIDFAQPEIAQPQIPDIPQIQPIVPNL